MRIRPIGIVVLAVMLVIGGIAFALSVASANLAGILIGGLFVAIPLLLFWYAIYEARRARREERLFREGIRGTVRIKEAKFAGFGIGDQYRVRLSAELELPDRPALPSVRRTWMPRFALTHINELKRDLVLPAFADRDDPSRFVIQW